MFVKSVIWVEYGISDHEESQQQEEGFGKES